MGCGSANTGIKVNSSNPKFTKEKNLYLVRQKEINLLGPDLLSECMEKGDGSQNGIDQIYKEMLNTKKLSQKLNEEEIKRGIKEVYVEREILKEDVLLEYNIQEKVSEKLSSYTNRLIEKYSKDGIQDVFNKLFSSYPKVQSGFLLTGNPANMIGKDLAEPFYNIIKFNDKLKVECLVFIIDNSQINDKNHLEKLGEIIACNEKLKTICIILKSDIPLNYNPQNLNTIFDAIRDHSNLQAIVLLSESSENKLKLTPIQETSLFTLIRTNSKLNAFVLGKFIVSQNFLQLLSKQFANNTNLKAFSFIANSTDSIKKNKLLLNELIDDGIAKSTSLNAVLIGGFVCDNTDKYDKLEKSISNINILQVVEDVDIEI